MREAHTKIDPQLAPAAEIGNGGGHKHEVACLLPGQTRRALWAALRAGEVPDEALTHVAVPETAVDREAVADRSYVRLSEGRSGFHGSVPP